MKEGQLWIVKDSLESHAHLTVLFVQKFIEAFNLLSQQNVKYENLIQTI